MADSLFTRIAEKQPIVIEAMKRFFNFCPLYAIFAFGLFLAAGMFFSACKSKPLPPPVTEIPMAFLLFEGLEAEDPKQLELIYTLKVENPFFLEGFAKLESWKVELNEVMAGGEPLLGSAAESGFSIDDYENLIFPIKIANHGYGETPSEEEPRLGSAAGSGASEINTFHIKLKMDVEELASLGLAPKDEYKVRLFIELGFYKDNYNFNDSAPFTKITISALAVFPCVEPPVFNITSIAILKAELINTRFRVGLKIDNPNPYPVELSNFAYELYGNGRLWADGEEKNILKVNGKSSLEGNLFLMMNFINMKRDLLDQIIYLEDVNYRFKGEALVITGVEYLPSFKTEFNLSGYSQVFDH